MRRYVLGVVVVLLFGVVGAVPVAAAEPAYVRVNQVGYPTSGAKRAYLLSSVAAGGTFSVRSSAGTAVFSGPVGPLVGSWSSTYRFVYALDFDAVATPGTYTVTAPGAVASPAFRVDSGAALYSGALANALAYYQVQRDGSAYVPSPLRTAPAHLHDVTAMTYLTPRVNSSGRFSGDLSATGVRIDASGGWADAGDYLKFLHGASYTAAMLLVGVRDFASMDGFTAEVRHGADWLLRMWDDPTRTLHYQVGIGTGNAKTLGDHDVWRLPQDDDTFGGTDPRYRYLRNRPVFRAGPPGSPISPNLAGREAAALALAYQVFRVSDPTFAARCLLAAAHVFDLADPNPGQLVSVIPYSFYPETSWRDDLELGATELYLALTAGPPPAGLPRTAAYYLQQAAAWAQAYVSSDEAGSDTLNLYDVSGLAHYELHRAIGRAGNPPGLAITQAALVGDLRAQLDRGVAVAARDAFQFGFPWATWDTTSHGAGLSVTAAEYAALTGDTAFQAWSARWLGNILGANAWGVSLIIGTGTTWPNCPHHQLANLVGSLDGSPPVLRGAAVEGPNSITGRGTVSGTRACPPGGGDPYAPFNGSGAVFLDDVASFPTIEPAIDLTAASPLAFAWQGLRP